MQSIAQAVGVTDNAAVVAECTTTRLRITFVLNKSCLTRSDPDPSTYPERYELNVELLTTLVPVFVPISVGFVWKKLDKPYDTGLVTTLVMSVGAPCLVLSTLSREQIQLSTLVSMGAATGCALALLAVTGLGLLMLIGLPYRSYLPPLVFGNTGNLGLAVCLFAFGKEGLSLAIVFYVISSICLFTVGTWLWSGVATLGGVVKTPLIYAAVLAVFLLLSGARLPAWINRSVTLIGQITIPLMLITLGVSLSELKIHNLKRVLGLSALRLTLGLTIGLLVAYFLGIRGTARGVLLLECMTPVAVFNYLFSARYNNHPEEVAGLVFVSTLSFLLILPAVLLYV